MPKVDEIYKSLVEEGYSKKDAAKTAQARTGVALVTGQPIKAKQLKFTKKGTTYGQQDSLNKFKGGNLSKYRPYG